MDLSSSTVLVTGGASGIGLSLAKRFLDGGSKVIICGRRKDKLEEAKSKFPGFQIRVCDVAKSSERIELVDWVTQTFPKLNVLLNNAGIQRRIQLAHTEDWELTREEIAINLEAPIHLSRLLIPHFVQQGRATIINVSSGLAFVPLTFTPVYSSTKAALHSFTQSLRHQLASTSVKVIEVIPPAVNTDLGGAGKHTFGVPVDEFADAMMAGIIQDREEIGYQFSEKARLASRDERETLFKALHEMVARNQPVP